MRRRAQLPCLDVLDLCVVVVQPGVPQNVPQQGAAPHSSADRLPLPFESFDLLHCAREEEGGGGGVQCAS